MNDSSSRSHAIFTVHLDIKITKPITEGPFDDPLERPTTIEENIRAKFHFVDLAGSEKIKKTGA